jgi:uncharacterized membrane protein
MGHEQGKEMSGNKMVKIMIGTILFACILIVIVIQTFYVVYEPKERKQIEQDDQSSYTKSAMLQIDELLKLG